MTFIIMKKSKHVPKQLSKQQLANLFLAYRSENPPLEQLAAYGGVKSLLQFARSNGEAGLNSISAINTHFNKEEQYVTITKKGISQFIENNLKDPLVKGIYILNLALFCLSLGSNNTSILYESTGIFVFLTCLLVLAASAESYYYHYLMRMKSAASARYNKVIRDRKMTVRPVWEIRFGDIVELEVGTQISVSGLLIQGEDIMVEEKQKVGKSGVFLKQTVKKGASGEKANPFMICGSKVLAGHGRMVALVGNPTNPEPMETGDSQVELISPTKTKFQEATIQFGKVFTITSMLIVLVYSLVQILLLVFKKKPATLSIEQGMKHLKNLITLICLFITCVSSNSSLIVIATLTSEVQKMKERNIIIKNYEAFENLQLIPRICIDQSVLGDLSKDKTSSREALKRLRGNGVRVILLTELNKDQAIETAKGLGLLDIQSSQMEASAIGAIDFKQNYSSNLQMRGIQSAVQKYSKEYLPKIQLFYEASHSDKLDLVWYLTEVCQEQIGIVGVPGSQAISPNNISIECKPFINSLTPSSPDITILNSAISSINCCLLSSRSIVDCIRRFLELKYSTSITLSVVQTLYFAIHHQFILSAPEIIWINIIIDIMAITISQLGASHIKSKFPSLLSTDNWSRIILTSSIQILITIYYIYKKSPNASPFIFQILILLILSGVISKNSPDFSMLKRKGLGLLVMMFVVFGGQFVFMSYGYRMMGSDELKGSQYMETLMVGCSGFLANIVIEAVLRVMRK